MKLKVRSIHEQGKAADEYVLLEVEGDCNLTNYGLADTTYTSSEKISNRLRHFHWFKPKAVKKGEFVVLFSKTGTDDEYKDSGGNHIHRCYWNLKSAVWNNTGDAAVLFHLNDWKTTKAR